MYAWHETLWQQLAQSQRQHRFHHALLLHGLVGVGKQALATALAEALLCEQHQFLTSCGQCKSCALFKANTHPDLITIAPQGQSISVDEIRELASFVHHSAQQNGNKVAIIVNAHKMTHSAANALLKTLEEPNPGRYLLLTCDDISQLPATILSRCNKIQVAVNDRDLANEWIQQQLPSDIDYPWLNGFVDQPLKVQQWYLDNQLELIDMLYKFASDVKASHNFESVQRILSDTPELVDVLCLFIQQHLKASLLNGLALQAYNEAQKALNQFMADNKQILGLNQSLALSKLVNTIKRTIK
ncbi:DNA polymerase III subunit delta' [Pseudoalteromonas sp. S16_S37]|uniref:DNA polymerase III subunit delta' n=1 Tax=Pseudoalteromonas sp. S16_S37 TaxID=2720228 RepID=UPI00168071E9|nr:DNA polymerase III subunit delta' [Pseudoalteromonas sp. S16_S37]MBD1581326.1 DNA polymerase III subunit delta' [Pseudoalteromonas sp. S16_S37]